MACTHLPALALRCDVGPQPPASPHPALPCLPPLPSAGRPRTRTPSCGSTAGPSSRRPWPGTPCPAASCCLTSSTSQTTKRCARRGRGWLLPGGPARACTPREHMHAPAPVRPPPPRCPPCRPEGHLHSGPAARAVAAPIAERSAPCPRAPRPARRRRAPVPPDLLEAARRAPWACAAVPGRNGRNHARPPRRNLCAGGAAAGGHSPPGLLAGSGDSTSGGRQQRGPAPVGRTQPPCEGGHCAVVARGRAETSAGVLKRGGW